MINIKENVKDVKEFNLLYDLVGWGSYDDKILSTITFIEKYLNRIKESGQYDNSIIIILADHGNNGYDPIGRQNPILYIKGFDELHSEMIISDKKVSYEDLNNNQYDLILLDIQLPEISGYELLSSINKKLKVIVVSACAMEEEINKAYEYGCLDYITKPINVADFIKRIKIHID